MILKVRDDTVSLVGGVRSNFWPTLRVTLDGVLAHHPEGALLDCSEISDCTGVGADVFFDVANYAAELSGADVILVAPPPKLEERLRSVPDARSQLSTAATAEDARRTLALRNKPVVEPRPRGAVRTAALVSLVGQAGDEETLAVARDILRADEPPTHVLLPIVVPRELPLQAPLPEQERAATHTIQQARAALGGVTDGLHLRLQRTRDLASLVAEVAAELKASPIVIGLPAEAEEAENLVKRVARKTGRRIVFVRPAQKVEEE